MTCHICAKDNCIEDHFKAEPVKQEPVAWMNTNGAVNKLREAGWAMNSAPVSVEAAALAEREACAKVCDAVYAEFEHPWNKSKQCAAAIRARGEK